MPKALPPPPADRLTNRELVLSNVKHRYRYSDGHGKPPINVDEDYCGDLYLDTSQDQLWLHRFRTWQPASPKKQPDGLPCQKHPYFGTAVLLHEGRWVDRLTLSESSILRHLSCTHLYTMDRQASTTGHIECSTPPHSSAPAIDLCDEDPTPSDSVAHAKSPSPPLPDSAAASPVNEWIGILKDKWCLGPARLSGTQLERGARIFDVLAQFPDVIPTIHADSGELSDSHCIGLGQAERHGPPPTDHMVFSDLLACNGAANISNSLTNLEEFEGDVSVVTVLAQQTNFLRHIPLQPGQPLYTLLDIPAKPEGLLQCQFGTGPFSEGVNALISPATTTWTFPGAITYPHLDGICGMYVVHLMGDKLWMFWPASEHNCAAIAPSRLQPLDFDAVLALLTTLQGLHVLNLTEDHCGASFHFPPNTIHFCLSLTESRHLARPIRATAHLPLLPDVFRWEKDWILDVLMKQSSVDSETKRSHVDRYVDSILHYQGLARDITQSHPSSGRQLMKMLRVCWNDISTCAKGLKIDAPVF